MIYVLYSYLRHIVFVKTIVNITIKMEREAKYTPGFSGILASKASGALFHFAKSLTASSAFICPGKEDDYSWIPTLPVIAMVPPSYFLRPSIHSRNVVLPAPFTPSRAKISPYCTQKSKPSSTTWAP